MRQYELAEQCLMTAAMLNLVLFITCILVFVKVGDLQSIGSYAMMAVAGTLTLVTFVRFYNNPHPCDYFRYSFRETNIAMLHCFLYILTIVTSLTLLVMLPSLSFAPAIPLLLQCFYTLLYRPYKEPSENVRSTLNLLTMCAFLALRVYAQYASEMMFNGFGTFLAILLCYGLLLLVLVLSVVFTVFYFHYYNYKLPELRKLKQLKDNDFKQVVLQEIGEFDPNKKMSEVEAKLTFRPLIEPENTMLNFTHEIQPLPLLQENSKEARE